jgi:hypothetical protein
MMVTSNGQVTHLIIAIIRTPRIYKSYWPWFVSKVLSDSKRNRGSSVRNKLMFSQLELGTNPIRWSLWL